MDSSKESNTTKESDMTMKSRVSGLVLLAICSLVTAACEDNDNNVPIFNADAGLIESTFPDAGLPPAASITIQNFRFSPQSLTVPRAHWVRVINLDNTPHSVTSQTHQGDFVHGSVAGISFDTGPFTGESTIGFPLGLT